MKQILVELDEDTARRLEQVAPGRLRQRSAFVRAAIRRVLDEIAERHTAEAYRVQPDDPGDVVQDPTLWQQRAPRRGRRR